MTQPNLLDIVPEQLFQTHFISDIDQVQKKLQYEIERKREELRAMVGERYRDLIHAADTIEEMKVTTASTLNHIGEMMSACRNLHNTHLVGFKIENKAAHQSFQFSQTDSVHSLAVQVKLLMEIPEKIWTCIEAEDFVKATQLFIMARHVNTGIQLQIGGKNIKPGMQSLHRLVQQHWNSISNFNQTIIDVCRQKLQDVDIGVEVACSCLVSLYLLDSQSLVELLNTLISLQSHSSLKSTLRFDLANILEGDVKAQIREKIVNGVKIVLKTVVLVYACFVDNDGGAVLVQLKELFRKDSQPLVELARFSDPVGLKLLPPVIYNYRLSSNKEVQGLAKEEITKCVQKWGVWVKSFIEESVQALLQNITRVKFLHEIREEAFKVETPSNWGAICTSLDIPEVHVWCHYFQPLLTARVKAIIDNRWVKVYDQFKTQILVDLTKVSSESETEKEADINWFVWKDLIGETVIESRNDVIKVMTSLMKGMTRQDQGITPTLEKLCEALDSELCKLLEDLKVYLSRDKRNSVTRDKILFAYEEDDESDQIYSDKEDIELYLRDISDRNIQSMLQYIKACFEEPTLQSTELQRKTTAIYTARYSQAIPTLMPNLRKCYIPEEQNTLGVISVDENAVKRWNELCAMLKESYLYCWGKWVDIVEAKIEEMTKGLPQEFTLEANVDYLMMQWDVIKIEEKDDEGNAIESTIKVPAGPSLKLQEYLYSISRILDEVVPHTLPIEIHTLFIEKLTTITFAHYNRVIREKEADINQRCALQLLMDVRHMTLLLVPRENKKSMELSHEVCEFLRQKIDPFDYDVFYPYIQTNLKRSVQRVQTLLGSLILHHGQLTGIIGNKPVLSGGSGDKAAGLLASGDSHWFSLLPVATPPSLHKKQDKPTKKKVIAASPNKSRSDISDLMTSSLPINFANARSGAASFFNSMTSDWFSGS
ncbi:conserved oligomeric Golgi complex subunit 1 isoform X4 [Ostrinia furnacalis]|uniref:conserved oligomeric Golgi complex subunit 1 isoform X1 n=1 Tax=Ostrinia furnacalis TaxID=93504 RepID=UPI00103CD97D|nr:conserved oligomeric Golgi complex subunit 1 isoform X1 [Ostrinia furnacalis]XP_028161088.1 conserved oligomeric Golgi complex subunit 1 isoform X3 [Ostrinia furnacalis]XP_028161090.1 conserved oligomeric Golgi complex subunit 1 isoform X4 [Ostrinia furnacalis]